MKVTIRTRSTVPPVVAGQHGKEAEFVLLRTESAMTERKSIPIGPPEHVLEFEVMPGSETERAILVALQLAGK